MHVGQAVLGRFRNSPMTHAITLPWRPRALFCSASGRTAGRAHGHDKHSTSGALSLQSGQMAALLSPLGANFRLSRLLRGEVEGQHYLLPALRSRASTSLRSTAHSLRLPLSKGNVPQLHQKYAVVELAALLLAPRMASTAGQILPAAPGVDLASATTLFSQGGGFDLKEAVSRNSTGRCCTRRRIRRSPILSPTGKRTCASARIASMPAATLAEGRHQTPQKSTSTTAKTLQVHDLTCGSATTRRTSPVPAPTHGPILFGHGDLGVIRRVEANQPEHVWLAKGYLGTDSEKYVGIYEKDNTIRAFLLGD